MKKRKRNIFVYNCKNKSTYIFKKMKAIIEKEDFIQEECSKKEKEKGQEHH